jgi:hypothetical protein
MADQRKLLELEKKFWTEGATFYRESVDRQCILAFPQTASVLSNLEAAVSLGAGPRWREVEIWPRGIIEPTEGFVILTYRARAIRPDGEMYDAVASTGYIRRDGAWKLVFHQQSPVKPGDIEEGNRATTLTPARSPG